MSAPFSIALIFSWWTKSLVKRRCTSHSKICSFSDFLKAQLCQNVLKTSFLQTISSKVSPFCNFWARVLRISCYKDVLENFFSKILRNCQKNIRSIVNLKKETFYSINLWIWEAWTPHLKLISEFHQTFLLWACLSEKLCS